MGAEVPQRWVCREHEHGQGREHGGMVPGGAQEGGRKRILNAF